ncbi:MAG TPA: hypothetical protein VJ372_02240 [Pyrinomonadaceae bacterium]|jgi:hypothetical protein|nr:hypothetical protein [Pyrinomonadaceae bacterium]
MDERERAGARATATREKLHDATAENHRWVIVTIALKLDVTQ